MMGNGYVTVLHPSQDLKFIKFSYFERFCTTLVAISSCINVPALSFRKKSKDTNACVVYDLALAMCFLQRKLE